MTELIAGAGVARDDPLLDVARASGKGLRPTLLLLSAALCGGNPGDLVVSAAAVELLHVATLYHDDIIDRAALRRGLPAPNASHGNTVAALGGTYLLGLATSTLAEFGTSAYQLAVSALSRACAGELHELENSFDHDLDLDSYLGIVELKTSSLMVLPCVLGASAARASRSQSHEVEAYGYHLGLAFQFIDDVLDLTGASTTVGKTAGTDLLEGVLSLPMLLCLRTSGYGDELRHLLDETTDRADTFERVRDVIVTSGAVDGTREMAKLQVRRASSALDDMPEGPPAASLRRLAAWVLTRDS